jgi:hypothetical protein
MRHVFYDLNQPSGKKAKRRAHRPVGCSQFKVQSSRFEVHNLVAQLTIAGSHFANYDLQFTPHVLPFVWDIECQILDTSLHGHFLLCALLFALNVFHAYCFLVWLSRKISIFDFCSLFIICMRLFFLLFFSISRCILSNVSGQSPAICAFGF